MSVHGVSDNSEIAIADIPNNQISWLANVDDGLVMESNSKALDQAIPVKGFWVGYRMKHWKNVCLEKTLEVVHPVMF